MLRNLLSAVGVSSLLLAAPLSVASAADMPLKAPSVPMPAASWTGCYLDAGGGYGMYSQDTTSETFPGLVPTTVLTTLGGRGWLGRFGGGCDYQLSGGLSNWVIGAFADYDIMNLKGTYEDDFFLTAGNEKESSALYAGARIGYLVTPGLMTYVSGGWTNTHFNTINLFLDGAPFSPEGTLPSNTYHGWFIGGGTEYALNFSWLPIRGLFWRSEYRYASYDSADLQFAGLLAGSGDHFTRDVQTITSSLVWRFNMGR